MIYLITCICQRSLLRSRPEGICENCGKKETQYDVALKEHMEWMNRQNFNENGIGKSLGEFNKRWNA